MGFASTCPDAARRQTVQRPVKLARIGRAWPSSVLMILTAARGLAIPRETARASKGRVVRPWLAAASVGRLARRTGFVATSPARSRAWPATWRGSRAFAQPSSQVVPVVIEHPAVRIQYAREAARGGPTGNVPIQPRQPAVRSQLALGRTKSFLSPHAPTGLAQPPRQLHVREASRAQMEPVTRHAPPVRIARLTIFASEAPAIRMWSAWERAPITPVPY